jgi:hypothetical protein
MLSKQQIKRLKARRKKNFLSFYTYLLLSALNTGYPFLWCLSIAVGLVLHAGDRLDRKFSLDTVYALHWRRRWLAWQLLHINFG